MAFGSRTFARVSGEAFDADQITLPCEQCGLSEYECECELEDDEEADDARS